MVTLLSIHTVSPGREQDYETLQRRLWLLTHAREPGVVRYEHFRGTRERQYCSILAFRDLDAFLAHQVADYHDAVDWDGLFEDLQLQWLDPLPGASDLAPTVIPPLAADVDALRRRYAGMLPPARPAWWGRDSQAAGAPGADTL